MNEKKFRMISTYSCFQTIIVTFSLKNYKFAYVLDDFERPDVGELCGDELPERRLLVPQLLTQLTRTQQLTPVVLQAEQS